ncbi:MAG: DUF3575 domain-containing protein [Saprospiraceae bacterium]|nr:DUF3575 domain-containing protein [Saprospiraceae bacterium]
MKNLIVTAVLTFLLCAGVKAQSYDAIIKTNPISLAFGNFNATYEHVLNEKSSILGSLSYQYRLLGVDVNAFGIGGAYRYYFTHAKKEVPSGFYVNPRIRLTFGSAAEVNYGAFQLGGEVGYQWAWDSGFVLDLGIGPNFTSLFGSYEDIAFDNDGATFILPSLTIAIGYAW